ADYNYGFDPRVRLRRFFDAKQSNHIFLIDEAHNLLSRSIDMFSETLTLDTLLSASASMDAGSELQKTLNAVIKEAKRLLKGQSDRMEWIEVPSSLEQLRDLAEACLRTLLISDFPERPPMPLLEAWWMLDRFFDRLSELSERDRIIFKRQPEPQIVVACIEPGDLLQEALQEARSVVAFSATLRPRSWVESRLKVPTSAQWVGFPSPFAPENQFTATIRDIDVRYQSRSRSLPQLVSIIQTTVTARPGNYLVFCPSYTFLSGLATLFSETHPSVRTVVQQPDDSREDIERFVGGFKASTPILGFAVQGGRYAESIDFKGDLLIGAIIIGLGLAPRGALADAISELHPSARGYDESYRYPALLKTIQTAGRVIRSEQDRGVILLIDHRFEHKEHSHHLPHWWQIRPLTTATLAPELNAFWGSEPQ
ncbi:MAG: ATP-dependent DNA helicase, partial [Pseudomonadales bacterium]